jgi:type III secretion protein U
MSNSSGSKTEQPTDKKIRDARQKGQVPQADKFVQIVLAIVGMLLLLYGFRFFKEIIFDIFLLSFDAPFRDFEELTNTLYRHTISLLLFYMVPSISLLANTQFHNKENIYSHQYAFLKLNRPYNLLL